MHLIFQIWEYNFCFRRTIKPQEPYIKPKSGRVDQSCKRAD